MPLHAFLRGYPPQVLSVPRALDALQMSGGDSAVLGTSMPRPWSSDTFALMRFVASAIGGVPATPGVHFKHQFDLVGDNLRALNCDQVRSGRASSWLSFSRTRCSIISSAVPSPSHERIATVTQPRSGLHASASLCGRPPFSRGIHTCQTPQLCSTDANFQGYAGEMPRHFLDPRRRGMFPAAQ